MKIKSIFLIAITVAGCSNPIDTRTTSETTGPDSVTKTYIEEINKLENQSTRLNYDSLGELISKIRFDVRTNNLKDFEDGKVPWIRIDSPQVDMKDLIGRDEIVISQKKIAVIIDYPLSVNYRFMLMSESGFSRKQLINEISRHYYELYDEEEKTATIKTVSQDERRIYNRNHTNGKFGIWGHDIGDLVLDEIHVYRSATGEVVLTLQLES